MLTTLPANHIINNYNHLITRLDPKQIEAMVETNKASLSTPLPAGEGQGVRASAASMESKRAHKPKLPADLISKARELRTAQTDAEQLMWFLLRDRQIANAKFRRQHPLQIGDKKYVLDFYCHELGLAVELDGSQHQEQVAYDVQRTRALAGEGVRVLRFWNNEVLQETEAVLEVIWGSLQLLQKEQFRRAKLHSPQHSNECRPL